MSDTPRIDAAAKAGSDLGQANEAWSGIWPLARQLERENAALREQVAEERDLVEKLQRALMFWMPAIAGSGTEAGERAAADAYLLVGYAGPFEKSAEDRKWVRASVFARGEGEVIEAGDVIHSRGLPFRLVYDAEVEGANGDLSRNLCK